MLPQYLYLFRTHCLSAQSTLNNYLWLGKRVRCACSRLIKLRKAGGVDHTHIHDYYLASILSQLKGWFPPAPNTFWAELEQFQVLRDNLYNFLISNPFLSCMDADMSLTIQVSIEAWSTLPKVIPSSHKLTPLKFLLHALSLLISGILLTGWCSSGIFMLEDYLLVQHSRLLELFN